MKFILLLVFNQSINFKQTLSSGSDSRSKSSSKIIIFFLFLFLIKRKLVKKPSLNIKKIKPNIEAAKIMPNWYKEGAFWKLLIAHSREIKATAIERIKRETFKKLKNQ